MTGQGDRLSRGVKGATISSKRFHPPSRYKGTKSRTFDKHTGVKEMGWNVGDIITVKLVATYLGEEIQNKLTYNIVTFGVSADIDTLTDTIEGVLLDYFLPLQLPGLIYNLVRLDNATNRVDFSEVTSVKAGERTGLTNPSYVAGGFTKRVGTKLTRPGAIRLSGIRKEDVVANAYTPSDISAQAFEIALAAPLTNGLTPPDDIVVEPVVARYEGVFPTGTWIVNPVTAVQRNSNITTQNSRKA